MHLLYATNLINDDTLLNWVFDYFLFKLHFLDTSMCAKYIKYYRKNYIFYLRM